MPLFRYRALSAAGKRISGVIDADSFPTAKERLRKQQVMVTDLSLLDKKREELTLPSDLLLNFTRELSQLLRAGLPLYESLLTIEEKYRANKAHPLFLDLCDRLKGGSSLSAALKQYPSTFDSVYLSLVQSAEQSAALPQIFEQISLLLTRQQKLKKQLFSALAYPAFLGVFCLFVVGALLFFVIPSMRELFEGRQLHPLTEAVLGISRFFNENGLTILLTLVLSALGIYLFFRRKKGNIAVQKILLKVPFIKTVALQTALIRFCRALSILLSGGVPLLDALNLSRRVMKNPLLEEIVEIASKRIVEGGKLSQELREFPVIPSLVTRMLAIAEETGRMGPMLHNLADIYDEDLEKNLSQMTALLQPLLLLILGGIVGIVILSILLPLTDVSSFLGP